ncbi:unnamed protein product [Cuscuta epithymum]|uniref:Uncharacterized protein n=2 Tax=Cuscuta epithymum TaxID=186058 RepID=A0AAV0FRI8_9ASTE|nr:unnamed protein product [Cuscuta epithymum]
MGRAPCCDKAKVKKGPWSPEEDAKLKDFIDKNGTGGNWIALPQKAGLKRCGKSCRLRWLNYLRPNIKHGEFTNDEDRIICSLYATIGSRWSIIAGQLPGRTDNDIKNYWNTKLKKKLMSMMLLPPPPPPPPSSSSKQHLMMRSSSSSSSSIIPSALPLPPPPPSALIPTALPPPQNPFTSFSAGGGGGDGLDQQPFSLHHFYPTSADYFMYENNSSFHIFQEHHQGLMNPIINIIPQYHHHENQVFVGSNNDQVSGSSSDGSCSQISHVADTSIVDHLKQQPDTGSKLVMEDGNNNNFSFQGDENGHHHQGGGHNFFLDFGSPGAGVDTHHDDHENSHHHHHLGMCSNGGQFGNTNNTDDDQQQLQYDLDVVRDLVSCSSSTNNVHDHNSNINTNNFLIFDHYENKPDGHKGMYFY